MALLHALSLSSINYILITFAAGFTPSHSLLRPALLPLFLTASHYAFQASLQLEQQLAATFIGASCIALVAKYFESILINRWAFSAHGPVSGKGGLEPSQSSKADPKREENGSVLERLAFGVHVAANSRYPASEWAVKGIPAFKASEPNWLPSKGRVIATRLLGALLSFLFLDLLDHAGDPQAAAETFADAKIPFFSRMGEIAAEEVATRVVNVLVFWAVGYSAIQLQYCTFAVVGLMLPGAKVEGWPPLFGRLVECWSIRQFWGAFWHQNLRRNFGSPAHYFAYELIGLPKETWVARYLFIGATFTLSGVLHVFVDMLSFIPPAKSGAMVFFPLQAVGIMIEDGAQGLYKKVLGQPKGGAAKLFVRVVGYIWIISWMAYSTPVWVYPAMRTGGGRGRVLPFSLIDTVKG
ncbi:MAG: hypothetical protein MMC23_005044 [Stictis urceolatum]|nr:hypothetical protein [Stictis urceolata]